MATLLPVSIQAQTYTTRYLKTGIHQMLEDGTLYRIPFDSLRLDMTGAEEMSPLAVESGKTAVIELRSGQVLKVYGSDALIQTQLPEKAYAAYPGIMIPAGSTLMVFGNGEVIAYGGKAAQGVIGHNGGTPLVDAYTTQTGNGGAGGRGGNGSAPGIGGKAGVGGSGAPATIGFSGDNNDFFGSHKDPVSGANGEDGTSGDGMGKLMVVGNIKVTSVAGAGTPFETKYGARGAQRGYLAELHYIYASYGGAGGNGGAGDAALYDIGGGAPGAGGGGAGAAGGVDSRTILEGPGTYAYTGQGGKGGDSADPEISGHHGEGLPSKAGITGGLGGKPGSHGAQGNILVSSNVTLNATYDESTLEYITSSDQIPESIRKMMARKIVGATWTDGKLAIEMYYNQEMPQTAVNVLTDASKGNFLGYVDQFGKNVYNEKGEFAVDSADHSINFYLDSITSKWYITANDSVVLHPHWTGVKNIHVVRYMENPNFMGNSADPKRYYSSDSIFAEVITVPAETKDMTVKVPVFTDHSGKTVVSKDLYSFTGDATNDSVTITIPADQSVTTVELMFNEKRFNLAYEGLEDDIMSNQCTNIDDYTRAGALPFGKAINFPAFRQWEGRTLSHWEVKGADGKYQELTSDVMPAHDITIRPTFKEALFKTSLQLKGKGTAAVYVVTGNDTVSVEELDGIPYHANVLVTTTAKAKYRRVRAEVLRSITRKTVDAEVTDSTIFFPMPDDDAIIYVENEYHPHCTLAVLKSTENALGAENVVYYVTKDNKKFYTNDNDYYKFKGESFGGKVSELEYGVGDKLYLHTDFKGNDGSREAKLYIVRNFNNEKIRMEEVWRSQQGSADSTFYFYQLNIDSVMTETDVPLEIMWNNPRTQYHVQAVNSSKSHVDAIYSNGRDISNTAISYMNDPIEFHVATTDSTFNANNVMIEYFSGFDQMLISGGINTTSEGNFTLVMPESNVRITLTDGAKYSITTQPASDGTMLSAPFMATAGYPVICTIKYAENAVIPDEDDIHIYVNGVDVEASPELRYNSMVKSMGEFFKSDLTSGTKNDNRIRTKAFIMPACNAVITLGTEATGIEHADAVLESYSNAVYNLQGQKIAEMKNGRIVNGSMPKGVVIINGNKYLNK